MEKLQEELDRAHRLYDIKKNIDGTNAALECLRKNDAKYLINDFFIGLTTAERLQLIFVIELKNNFLKINLIED